MTYRRQEMEVEQREAQSLYRKPIEPWFVSIRPVISYMLREQRLLFVLVGIAIATLAFTILSPSSNQPIPGYGTRSSTQSISLYLLSTSYSWFFMQIISVVDLNRCSELLRWREAYGGDVGHGLPQRRQCWGLCVFDSLIIQKIWLNTRITG